MSRSLQDLNDKELLTIYKRGVSENVLNLRDNGKLLNELESEIITRMGQRDSQ